MPPVASEPAAGTEQLPLVGDPDLWRTVDVLALKQIKPHLQRLRDPRSLRAGLGTLPGRVPRETLELYLTHFSAVHKFSTLQRRVSGIRQAHQAHGHPSPVGLGARVILEAWPEPAAPSGCKKPRSRRRSCSKSAGSWIRRRAIGARDRALLVLGFATGLKRGEFAAPARGCGVCGAGHHRRGPQEQGRSAGAGPVDRNFSGIEIGKVFAKEQALTKVRGKKVRALIPLNLDAYLLKWQDGKGDEIRGRLAADFTGWKTNKRKFKAQVENIIQALRADEGAREPPPVTKCSGNFEKAAKAGHPTAMNNLGLMYYQGRGGPQDYHRARELRRVPERAARNLCITSATSAACNN